MRIVPQAEETYHPYRAKSKDRGRALWIAPAGARVSRAQANPAAGARAGPPLCPADPEPELAFQDLEDLILCAVNKQRRRVAGWGAMLEDYDAVLPIRLRSPNRDEGVQEPQVRVGVRIGHEHS